MLRKGQCLIEHIQHQHRKQAGLKVIGIRLGLCQLHETVRQVQSPTHLKLDLIEELRVTAHLMAMHIKQRKNGRVRCPQIMGEKAQHDCPLLLRVAFNTQVRQAPKPAGRGFAVCRYQLSAFQAQAAFSCVTELQQRQCG
ncbi:hypothetical protein D3C87_1366170 [compost metagenome]